jgi:hypothetical protein
LWEISVIIVVVDLVLTQSHFGSSNASATRPIHCVPRPQADPLRTPATGPSIAVAKAVIERDEGAAVVPTSSLMAVASQLAIGMSLPLPPELQSINCQLFNDAACSSQWPHELRKAWRQYCDEFGEVDRDPHQFANAALMIAKSNPKGAAAVFRSGYAALRCITTPPGVKQVAYFYDKIVDAAKYPLGMLIKRAASEHLEGRSLDFVLLAGS